MGQRWRQRDVTEWLREHHGRLGKPNSLLASLGARYDPGLVLGDSQLSYVTNFAEHPLTSGLTSVPFYGGYHVNAAGVVGGDVAAAIAFAAGGPVGMYQEHGRGRAYIWGDEWVEFSSQWTATRDTSRFWANAIDWLAHRR